jgi:hypothetical protein
MTLNDVLQDIIQHLDTNDNSTLAWEQVREWPDGAIDIFMNAGWIKPIIPAKTAVCPGCEENCFMPVHVSQTMQKQPTKTYVACDRRDDMGRISISSEMLQQWQITENQVSQWLTRELGLRGKPKRNRESGSLEIGHVQGKKNTGLLEWIKGSPLVLQVFSRTLPLVDTVYFEGNQLQIDNKAIMKMVDRPPPTDRYQPSNARREANKLNTLDRYKNWGKVYRKLKRENPEKSDSWCAHQISRTAIGKKFSPETIRKNMKK